MSAAARAMLGIGATLAAFGIALGAFGAHGLRAVLGPVELGWWHTGVQYQMWNAIGLVALSSAAPARTPAWLIAGGTLLFCGSLYLMALTGARWLGMVTPGGGALMIAGWALVAFGALKNGRDRL